MNHAITMGIFWHLIGPPVPPVSMPRSKSKTLVVETMWSVGGSSPG